MGLSGILFLQFAEFAPALILLGLRWILVLFILKPKAKPVHVPFVNIQLMDRLLLYVRFVRVDDEFDGFIQ